VVITGVADRVPEQIAHVVYLDAFVPEDGQSMLDIIPPDRRPALEMLVRTEGEGWLLPRFAAAPREKFVPDAWRVTDEADLRWMLARLAPTPFGHFKGPVRRRNPAAQNLQRTHIRCLQWPHEGFDRYADTARRTARWRRRELAAPHLPYITHASELVELLLKAAA
jgi:hypothetical protein